MKKLLSRALVLAMIGVLMLSFVGCEDDQKVVPPYYDEVVDPDDDPTDDPVDNPKVADPVFETFLLKSKHNASYLQADIECVISEDGAITYNKAIKTLKPVYAGITFIPSFEVPEGVKVYVGDDEQHSGTSSQDFSNPVTYRLENTEGEQTEYVVSLDFDFTGLPIVVIQTENNTAITSKDNWVKGTILIEGGDEFDDMELAEMEIAGRGNSTWGYEKKPYKIKLGSKAKVLGMPKHKRWVLLANYIDKTMIRNDVSFYLGKQTSLAWTPRGYHVELIVNGKHYGNYYLCEQIKIDENRVNITEVESGMEGPEVGYLMEMDTYSPDADETLFYSKHKVPTEGGSNNIHIKIKDPEAEDLTNSQLDYITGYFHDFEDALYGEDWLDAEKGYKNYIDLDSFIDIYLVSELIAHWEWRHPKSSYIYKDSGDKLVMGPMWDYDWYTFHTRTGWYCKNYLWFPRLFQDPEFVAGVKAHWAELYPKFRGAINYMTEMKNKLAASAEKNYKIWGEGMSGSPNGEGSMTYAQSVDKIIDRFTERIEWLNKEFEKL